MVPVTDADVAAYFRRSYTAVDGLWCMKVEEELGFERALAIDTEVWKVMPKIQARALKGIVGVSDGLEALVECLTTKLRWEGYSFQTIWDDEGDAVSIRLYECPWHQLMQKSGRERLAGRVGRQICGTEYAIWADEFGEGIRFTLDSLLCDGAPVCALRFERGTLADR